MRWGILNNRKLYAAIEGLLFVVGDEGLTPKQLADVLELEEEEVSEALKALQKEFNEEERGLQIVEIAGGYRLTTKAIHADYFKKLAASPLQSTLSQAALETLAIIAYRQPITRMDIEEIRGVKSERAIQTLITKLFIREVGRETGIGRPILYGTTPFFLDHFGLNSLDDLPPLPESEGEEGLEEEADLFLSSFKETLEEVPEP